MIMCKVSSKLDWGLWEVWFSRKRRLVYEISAPRWYSWSGNVHDPQYSGFTKSCAECLRVTDHVEMVPE